MDYSLLNFSQIPTQGLTGSIGALGSLGNTNYNLSGGGGLGLNQDNSGLGLNIPGLTGSGAASSIGGFGLNLPTLQFGLGALGSLNSLYSGFQAQRLARDQFNLTKDITNTNLNNSIKSYNTALEGRTRARTAMEGGSAEDAQAYIDRNRLTR